MGYSADDIIDKTLYAAAKVPIVRLPLDSETPIAYINPGNIVGVVYSYVMPRPDQGRQYLYWQFYDPDGVVYWAAQRYGYYDVQKLIDQGVQSDEAKALAEQYANLPWYEQLLTKYGKPLAIGLAVTLVVSAAVKGFIARPRAPRTE